MKHLCVYVISGTLLLVQLYCKPRPKGEKQTRAAVGANTNEKADSTLTASVEPRDSIIQIDSSWKKSADSYTEKFIARQRQEGVTTLIHYFNGGVSMLGVGGHNYVYYKKEGKSFLTIINDKATTVALASNEFANFIASNYTQLKNNPLQFPKTKPKTQMENISVQTDSGLVTTYKLNFDNFIPYQTHYAYRNCSVYHNGKTISTDRLYDEHFKEFIFDNKSKNLSYKHNINNQWYQLLQKLDDKIQELEDGIFKGENINNTLTIKL